MALRQTSADEKSQSPQALCLSGTTPSRRMILKLYLKLTLKPMAKASIVLSGSQHAVGHGNQSDMSFDSAKAPHLILVQPFRFAFLVIDFHGPAMATNTSDAFCLPTEAVADEIGRIVRQVRLAMVDDQALFAVVLDPMCIAVAVICLLVYLELDRNRLKNGGGASFEAARCSCLS